MSVTTTKSHIGREDIKWHDGQGNTFSRLTSTGSSLTMHKVGNEVDALTLYGSGDTYTEATISEAQSKANENSQEVVILLAPGTWTITDDLTLSGHTLRVPRGTTLSVSTGKTLTIDDIDAGPYQIFSGSGTSTFGASAPVLIYASWWADFATCISDLGSTNARTVIVTENEAVAADMEVTSNITLLFLPPGKLTIGAGKTVTLSGDVIAPRYQIFAGSGAVSWGTGYTIKNEYWEDGSTDEVTFNPTVNATHAELTTHMADTTTHGATGAVVGTTNTQELTNKTLNAAVGKGTWTASGTWTLPAMTLGADVTFSENVGLILDQALSADGKYCGIVEAGTAGATLAFGDLCYFAVADSRWELTDADAAATTFGKLGICVLAAANNGSATVMLLWGKIRADAAFPTLTVGAPVYVSTTLGDIQVAAPTGSGDCIRAIGQANTANELFFCPSPDWFEHA